MFIRKKNSLYTISLLGLLLCIVAISRTQEVEADITQTPDFTFGTTVDAALQISIRDGVSLYGHRTIFTGSGVDFGRVTFTNPELIGNGDAYVDNNKLYVEAILDIGIIFSGLLSVHVDLSKLMGAPNGFKNVFYSLSKNRSVLAIEVLSEPRANLLKVLSAPERFPLRMQFEISPHQSGNIADRFRIVASSQ